MIQDQIKALNATVEISDRETMQLERKIYQLQSPKQLNDKNKPLQQEVNNQQRPVAGNQQRKGFFRKIANGISGLWKKMFGKRNINNTATISLNSITQQRGQSSRGY